MDTKSKILDISLRLFNQEGINKITVRHIAKEIGISHGNLCYHYPNKHVIIEALYEQLVAELDVDIDHLKEQEPSLGMVWKIALSTYQTCEKFRFFFPGFYGDHEAECDCKSPL